MVRRFQDASAFRTCKLREPNLLTLVMLARRRGYERQVSNSHRGPHHIFVPGSGQCNDETDVEQERYPYLCATSLLLYTHNALRQFLFPPFQTPDSSPCLSDIITLRFRYRPIYTSLSYSLLHRQSVNSLPLKTRSLPIHHTKPHIHPLQQPQPPPSPPKCATSHSPYTLATTPQSTASPTAANTISSTAAKPTSSPAVPGASVLDSFLSRASAVPQVASAEATIGIIMKILRFLTRRIRR